MKILITGISSGIGLSLARLLQREELWGLARRRPSEDLGCFFNTCDVSQWGQVERAAEDLKQAWGKLDAIIHCAGVHGAIGKAMDIDPHEWTNTVRGNIEGAYFVIRAFFPLLLQGTSSRRKLILFSGGGASKPRPFFTAYGCAKTALVRLAETLAVEWADLPIDINIVAPGTINTDMTRQIVELGPQCVGEEEYRQTRAQLESSNDSLNKLHIMIRFLISEVSDGITGRFVSARWDNLETIVLSAQDPIHSQRYRLRRVVD